MLTLDTFTNDVSFHEVGDKENKSFASQTWNKRVRTYNVSTLIKAICIQLMNINTLIIYMETRIFW